MIHFRKIFTWSTKSSVLSPPQNRDLSWSRHQDCGDSQISIHIGRDHPARRRLKLWPNKSGQSSLTKQIHGSTNNLRPCCADSSQMIRRWRREVIAWCWPNAGPMSQTSARHWIGTGWSVFSGRKINYNGHVPSGSTLRSRSGITLIISRECRPMHNYYSYTCQAWTGLL